MRIAEVHDLGLMRWRAANDLQRSLVDKRKRGEILDQLLLVEHPHVITLGRNAHPENVLTGQAALDELGIDIEETNRGGDVTYHGPGQIVGYPILDLNEWKRDVHVYVRAVEEVIIRAIADFGVNGERSGINSGVWVGDAKVCAVGIHISRWITCHGFALNLDTNLDYFRHIVPCGLTQPVTSLRLLGVRADRAAVQEAIARHFGEVFGYGLLRPVSLAERIS